MKQNQLLISFDQLDVLGFHESHRMFVIMFIALTFIYLTLKLFITFLVRKNYMVFLTYFMLSKTILLIALVSAFLNENQKIIISSLQVLASFGFMLIIYKIYEKIKQLVK